MQKHSDKDPEYESALVKIITENWRLMQLFLKVVSKLDNNEAAKYCNQARYIKKIIDGSLQEIDLKIVDLSGEVYDAGMAATAINLEDFDSSEILIVEQMIEPLIMSKNGVKKQGLISLVKAVNR
ncbi:MAG: hypothetical protein LBB59_05125 [Campylobacteraceae bacterium]|jgi:hypothetical protein|nr:hypothetical protein [Campylobacteraceae bacterium]